jgi:ABC-type dipeptide/oligopeptide/nickel transport system ATPase subunit
MLLLIQRGQLELDAPVGRYWPEFAAADKEDVLVRHVLSHSTPVPGLTTPLTWQEATDVPRITELLAAQPPSDDPRATRMYHAFTYGVMCGELLRRVDGRTVGRFLAEEVAGPLDLELWIGLPPGLEPRVSTVELVDTFPGLREATAAAEAAYAAAQRAVDEAGRLWSKTTHALEVLEREAKAAEEARAAKAAAKRTASLYEKLVKAFGRDGIPARIIGNAIPELRIEANRLLNLLTDGQLSLSIDPVRETKSKSLKETLEVTVFDANGGKRAYEMYSGGERLRIDFALRVALSRLLATRAGARLETLVVDEGFGSQDAEGRMRLLEAVMRIRSEFRTVLVITHIDELKEHFPVRIEVRKDPQAGSLVSVV